MQGNLITAPAEFYVTFDFAIYFCSQKYYRKIGTLQKSPKMFFADGNFVYILFKIYWVSCLLVENFVADGKIFYSRSTLS